MNKKTVNDMLAFIAVAQEQSFTKAAGKLGLTSSALSHSIKTLEARLDMRLLARTTRKVSTTEAGEQLLSSIAPLFDEIDSHIEALRVLKQRPSGNIRLTCTDHVEHYVIRDKLAKLVQSHPDINVEILFDYGLTDIVEHRVDAGVRQGDLVSQSMIATRISADWRFSLVGSSTYLKRHGVPKTPYDLTEHNCAKLRLSTSGGIWAWEFQDEKGIEFNVRVGGQLTYNSILPGLHGALDGICLAYLPEDMTKPYLESGELQEILIDWSLRCEGFHLYYPNRRHHSPAFQALIEALRYEP